MARKLNPQEQEAFVAALSEPENHSPDGLNAELLQEISKKRDASLQLTPELAFWFQQDFKPRSPFF